MIKKIFVYFAGCTLLGLILVFGIPLAFHPERETIPAIYGIVKPRLPIILGIMLLIGTVGFSVHAFFLNRKKTSNQINDKEVRKFQKMLFANGLVIILFAALMLVSPGYSTFFFVLTMLSGLSIAAISASAAKLTCPECHTKDHGFFRNLRKQCKNCGYKLK